MKNSRSFLALVPLILSGLSVVSSCTENNKPNEAKNQEIIDLAVEKVRVDVENEINKTIPNLNIFIQTPEGEWFSSSAGEGFQPITADTYFRFASNTKNFTATAMINMMEDGWLDLDAFITDLIPGSTEPYVPSDPEWDFPFKNQITLKMLLNHSAGVYDVDNGEVPGFNGESYTSFFLNNEPDRQFTTSEMVNQLTLHNLSYFEPGTGMQYSNTGYAIAGEIIRRVYSVRSNSEKTLTDYLHDYLYGPESQVPLDIHFPNLASDQVLPSPRSCGHELLEGSNVVEYCDFNMSAQVAEGNGYTTMRNLNTWIRSTMKGMNVLTPPSIELMKTSVSAANPTYGLGCFYRENLGYGHNGARIGNLSLMIYDPVTDISIISYINAINEEDFLPTFNAIENVAYEVREALGYPGKP